MPPTPSLRRLHGEQRRGGDLVDGFSKAGFTTLRFNFRGIGGSTGRYDNGVGETQDVVAACRFLKKKHRGAGKIRARRLLLRRLGFGEGPSRGSLLTDLFLVAFPFSMFGTEGILAFPGTVYLVGGSLDDISPLDDLLSLHKEIKAGKYLKVIPSSYFFFEGRETDISTFILECLREEGGEAPCL